MINHTAMEMAMVEEAVVDGEDVVGVAIIAHTAVGKGTTITVVVVPAIAGPSYGRSQLWPWSRQKQWYL